MCRSIVLQMSLSDTCTLFWQALMIPLWLLKEDHLDAGYISSVLPPPYRCSRTFKYIFNVLRIPLLYLICLFFHFISFIHVDLSWAHQSHLWYHAYASLGLHSLISHEYAPVFFVWDTIWYLWQIFGSLEVMPQYQVQATDQECQLG